MNFAIFVNPEEPRPDQHDMTSKILMSWLLMALSWRLKKSVLEFFKPNFLNFLNLLALKRRACKVLSWAMAIEKKVCLNFLNQIFLNSG